MDELYVQCTLDKKISGGGTMTVTYLPQRLAVLGTVVSLQDVNGGMDGR